MRIELAHFILRSLQQFDGISDAVVQEVAVRAVRKCIFASAPEESEMAYGTDLSFKLWGELRDSESLRISPELFAEQIVRHSGSEFEIVAANTGHINGVPEAQILELFQQRLIESGAQFIFSADSCLNPAICLDGLFASDACHIFRRFDKQVRKMQDPDFDELKAVLEKNPERAEDINIMTLALMADSEIDCSIFLAGMGGRENVPWLFDRFDEDCAKFLKLFPDISPFPLSISREELLSGAYGFQKRLPVDLQEVTRGFLLDILDLRLCRLSSVESGRPEQWMRKLLSLIRRFYAFYNIPKYRNLHSLSAFELEASSMLPVLVGLISDLILAWKAQLSSCLK